MRTAWDKTPVDTGGLCSAWVHNAFGFLPSFAWEPKSTSLCWWPFNASSAPLWGAEENETALPSKQLLGGSYLVLLQSALSKGENAPFTQPSPMKTGFGF